MFETPCRVTADLRENERLVELAEAQHALPDFSDTSTVKSILPERVASSIAHLIGLLQMGVGADRDQLLQGLAQLERAMFVMHAEDI
jgi:hypothetical protein